MADEHLLAGAFAERHGQSDHPTNERPAQQQVEVPDVVQALAYRRTLRIESNPGSMATVTIATARTADCQRCVTGLVCRSDRRLLTMAGRPAATSARGTWTQAGDEDR